MATTALTPAATAYRSGLYEWLTTTDHKKIGILYIDQLVHLLLPRRAPGAGRPHGARPAGPPVRRRRRPTTSCSRCTPR